MIALGLIIYIYIYTILILSVNSTHILCAISCIYLIIANRNKIVDYIKKSKILILLFSIIVSIIFLIIMYGFNQFVKAYILVIENIPIVLAIYNYCLIKKINYNKLIKVIIEVGFLQSIFAILAFIFPSVQNLFLMIIDEQILWISSYRLYGLSLNLTYSTPVVQAIIGFICLYSYIINKTKRYLIYVPLILFSAIINARTSIIVIIIGVIGLVIINYRWICKLSRKKKIVGIIITISIILLFFIIDFNKILPPNNTFSWIGTGIMEIKSFILGKNTGYFDVLFNKFLTLPSIDKIFLGIGVKALGNFSDVGFINVIWNGGIVLLIILYPGYLYMFFNVDSNDKKFATFIKVIGIMSFIIMDIKGIATQPNNFLNLYMLLYIFYNLEKSQNNIVQDNNKNDLNNK